MVYYFLHEQLKYFCSLNKASNVSRSVNSMIFFIWSTVINNNVSTYNKISISWNVQFYNFIEWIRHIHQGWKLILYTKIVMIIILFNGYGENTTVVVNNTGGKCLFSKIKSIHMYLYIVSIVGSIDRRDEKRRQKTRKILPSRLDMVDRYHTIISTCTRESGKVLVGCSTRKVPYSVYT